MSTEVTRKRTVTLDKLLASDMLGEERRNNSESLRTFGARRFLTYYLSSSLSRFCGEQLTDEEMETRGSWPLSCPLQGGSISQAHADKPPRKCKCPSPVSLNMTFLTSRSQARWGPTDRRVQKR